MIFPTASLHHYPVRPCLPQGGFGLVMMVRMMRMTMMMSMVMMMMMMSPMMMSMIRWRTCSLSPSLLSPHDHCSGQLRDPANRIGSDSCFSFCYFLQWWHCLVSSSLVALSAIRLIDILFLWQNLCRNILWSKGETKMEGIYFQDWDCIKTKSDSSTTAAWMQLRLSDHEASLEMSHLGGWRGVHTLMHLAESIIW